MYETLRKQILPRLIPPQAKILAAVSGGPDSVALSHILWRFARETRQCSLVLTHVNHGVRPESENEAFMVQKLATDWNVPCIIHKFDSKNYARETGKSFQEAAREWRYARWQMDLQENSCTLLATAHHLGDQAETVLYRLLRGSGTAGLAGIHPNHNGIIRPLLGITKAEIIKYCELENLEYAIDRSNEEPIYARNKIRLELLPELQRNYNPGIFQILGHTADVLRWDEEYLHSKTEELWSKYLLKFTNQEICLSHSIFREPPALLSRLLRKAAGIIMNEPRGLGYTYISRIMEAAGFIGWSQNLPGSKVQFTGEGVCFSRNYSIEPGNEYGAAAEIEEPHTVGQVMARPFEEFGKWVSIPELGVKFGLFEYNEQMPIDPDESAVFDYDEINARLGSLVCRTRNSGDTMWFKHLGHKSLKKIFQEQYISSEKRNRLPLVVFDHEVLWIPKVRQSDCFRESQGKKAVFIIEGKVL